MEKVILISIDGCRADALAQCGNPYVEELKRRGAYTLTARTVYPSVTLPCHLSLFHSVPPARHGTLTNDYVVPVRPVPGLFEQLRAAGCDCAMYYGWEPLREVARPKSLMWAGYFNAYAAEHTDGILTDMALQRIAESKPDFVFLYMVETDEKGGHDSGWMTDTYLDYVRRAIDNVQRVVEAAGHEYTVIVTADHGGHDRSHGTDKPEDMTIPQFFMGPRFTPGRDLGEVSLLVLAPTIAELMGVRRPREWEGRSLAE